MHRAIGNGIGTMESGRDVFCLPGSVESPMSRGCHLLIRQGARLVESAEDILEEIPALAALLGEKPPGLTPVERTVLGHVGRSPLVLDQVVARTRLPETYVRRALAALVSKGLATEQDQAFVRK